MTFKKRLWNTITLTILIFLVRLHSAPLLGRLDFSTSEVSKIYNLSLLIVCVPFLLFVIQSIFYYLFKKDYPVQNRTIKHPVLRILGWIIIIAPVVLYYFLNYQDRKMHSDGGYILSAMVAFGFLFITPLYWLWIIKELKDNYGTKTGIGSFLLVLFGFFIYAHFSTSCPADKPLKSYDGCHACDELETISMNHPEDCTKFCPDRYRDRYDCLFATKSCPEDKPLKKVGRIVVMGKNFEEGESDCYSCDEPENLKVSNCSDCPNRYLSEDGYNDCVLKKCPADKPLQSRISDECFSCDDPRDLDVKNCSVCPDRHGDRWACHPCPADKPLLYEGKCYSCNDPTPVNVVGCTNICPNRDIKNTGLGWACIPKSVSHIPCPKEKPLMGRDYAVCYACDGLITKGDVLNCSACDNRKITKSKWGNLCSLKECPPFAPLRDEDGSCYSCDEVKGLYSIENCSVCSNRGFDGKICKLKVCPPDKPARDMYGTCHSCDEEESFDITDKKDCEICENRGVFTPRRRHSGVQEYPCGLVVFPEEKK